MSSDVPAIFDLPRPLALRRYQEFARTIQPVLQRRCAECHNENARTEFQLVQVRTRREQGDRLVLHTNLEATLNLVTPEDPTHSPLLTVLLLPHPPSNQPLLNGPNHHDYRQLSAWVRSLQPTGSAPSDAGVERTSLTGEGSGFAADRLGASESAVSPPAPSRPMMTDAKRRVAETDRVTPTQQPLSVSAAGVPAVPPGDLAFPTSPLSGRPDAAPVVVRGGAAPNGSPTRTTATAPQGNNSDRIFVPGQGYIPVDRRALSASDKGAKSKSAKIETKIPIDKLQKVLEKQPAGP
jgi:hypothetical protein